MKVEFDWSRFKLKIDYFVIRWGDFDQKPSVTRYCFNLFGSVITFTFYGRYYTGYRRIR